MELPTLSADNSLYNNQQDHLKLVNGPPSFPTPPPSNTSYPSQQQQPQQEQQYYSHVNSQIQPTPPHPLIQHDDPSSQNPNHQYPSNLPPPSLLTSSTTTGIMTTQPLSGGISYQGPTPGLVGWNDPPSVLFSTTSSHGSNRKNGRSTSRLPMTPPPPPPNNSIPPERDVNVMGVLMKTIEIVRPVFEPSNARLFGDTSSRLDSLFDRLSSSSISSIILTDLNHLAIAVEDNDLSKANQISLELMTSALGTEGRWVVGLKRLIEMWGKCQGMQQIQ